MAGRGRPAFQPTDKQRGQVEAMAVCGIPEMEIARALDISEPTLRKHFRDELDVSQTKVRTQIGTFIVNTILGRGDNRLSDERARGTLAIFYAKTQMGWKETSVHEHTGKDGKPIEVSTVRERIKRRLTSLAAASAAREDSEGTK